MSDGPNGGSTCDVCQQPFSSEQELQQHQNSAHGENPTGDRQSNYDIEQDQPNERKIA